MSQHRHSSTFFDPKPQPYYGFKDGTWQKSSRLQSTSTSLPAIKLLTWNIDFQTPFASARMTRALEYLQGLITALPTSTAPIVMFQEMTSTTLSVILSNPWIRQSFHITDPSHSNWLSGYGTTTLIDRRLPITSVFRVNYTSNMDRDALFVDIEDLKSSTTIRFCNTHLESLARHPPLRPAQVMLAARYLKDPTVDGGVMAGDFNAIQDFDKRLHEVTGLNDAFLEGNGVEGSEEGWTWGMQSPEEGEKYPCSRMDKVWYCGCVMVERLEKFGAGVKTEGEGVKAGHFVTDHLGLMVDVALEEEPS